MESQSASHALDPRPFRHRLIVHGRP